MGQVLQEGFILQKAYKKCLRVPEQCWDPVAEPLPSLVILAVLN